MAPDTGTEIPEGQCQSAKIIHLASGCHIWSFFAQNHMLTKSRSRSIASQIKKSGRGEIILGNGETYNSSSSKSVPGSSDETAANPGAAARSGTKHRDTGSSSTREQPDWTMQPGEPPTDVGGLLT